MNLHHDPALAWESCIMAVKGGVVKILSGETTSNTVRADMIGALAIQAPGTLTGACKVQVSVNGSSWQDAPSGSFSGVNVIVIFETFPYPLFRVLSGSAEAADREFAYATDMY